MKISKTTLHQIIKEEVASLWEAPQSLGRTRVAPRKGPKDRRADKDREAAKDFFGSDDPLVTKVGPQQVELPIDKTPAADPEKTVALSPEKRAALQFDLPDPKQATERPLNDPDRIAITAFAPGVRKKLLETYESETGITIDDRPLGHGEFGIVYQGENPEYGPVAVKMTLSGQEMNAYKNIKKLKDGLEERDPEAGNVLPTILDIRTIPSPPVGPAGNVRQGRYIEKEDGRPYKVFVVQMELLEKLDPETRSDVFGANPAELPHELEQRADPEALERITAARDRLQDGAFENEEERAALRQDATLQNADVADRVRAIPHYLSIRNVYSSLKKLLGEDWERLLDNIRFTSAQKDSEEFEQSQLTEATSTAPPVPLTDKAALEMFKEIEDFLREQEAYYLKQPAYAHIQTMYKIHGNMADEIPAIVEKYVSDAQVLERVSALSGLVLPTQMAANVRLPQYDPEKIKDSPALSSSIVPPSELASPIVQSFYDRLDKLKQWKTEYGDVHANNLMKRPNGDLVVADVGLFLFGPEGDRGYAGAQVERLQRLAGLI
jgi:hypothetical protein